MRHRTRLILAAILAAAPSCLDPVEVKLEALRFDPRPIYRTLWTEVEACSGLHGDFNRVRWYIVPTSPFRCPPGTASGMCRGLRLDPNDIYIASGFVDDSGSHYFTVRHEILHELGARPGHPPVFDTCHLRSLEQDQPPGPLATPNP